MDTFLRCDSTVSLTARLIDGTVAADRRELVELHLLVCPACLSHVGKVRDLRASLSSLPGRPPPEHLLTLATGNAAGGATAPTVDLDPAERTSP
ncbi:zf-HC2 domain-containing protein [Micromonospora sp. NPDC005215]|uniref:anti-sigma factor family protein n=1 Tax=Micromonospora sp. NPDC005215 TaxID=3157024 RepID=UPI0033B92145